jgi:hypothetical protein
MMKANEDDDDEIDDFHFLRISLQRDIILVLCIFSEKSMSESSESRIHKIDIQD